MKIGVISDIHGNKYAFQRVAEIARKNSVSKLLILGDIVGYYYGPDMIMDELKNWDYELIRGNHEELLGKLIKGQADTEQIRKKYGSGHQHAINKLKDEQVKELLSAPQKKTIEIEGVRFLMCHGSAFDPDYYLYPDAATKILDECNETDADFVLVGHSHYPFFYRAADSTLVNVGSVGQSRIQGGVANWIIIDTTNKVLQPMATTYDIRLLLEEIKENDPDVPYLQEILMRNAYE